MQKQQVGARVIPLNRANVGRRLRSGQKAADGSRPGQLYETSSSYGCIQHAMQFLPVHGFRQGVRHVPPHDGNHASRVIHPEIHRHCGRAYQRIALERLLAEIADGLPRETGTAATLAASDHSVAASRYQRGIRKALNHIHDHFTEPLKLADMAALSGASVTYFCLLFKHETGMRFRQYVNSLRIERACVLLRTTSDNAMDICFQVGFNDYSHFSRQFKRLTGVTAKVYRNQPHAPTGTATGRGTLRD